jgi:hypothetical protein
MSLSCESNSQNKRKKVSGQKERDGSAQFFSFSSFKIFNDARVGGAHDYDPLGDQQFVEGTRRPISRTETNKEKCHKKLIWKYTNGFENYRTVTFTTRRPRW